MSYAVRSITVAVSLCCLLTPSIPLAEESSELKPAMGDTAPELPEEISDIETPAVWVGAESIVATRFKTSSDTAPMNVTVISAQDIYNCHAHHLAEVLERCAGIYVQNRNLVTGADAQVDLGGFGATGAQNSLLLLNGRRLNDLTSSGAYLASIALSSIERIEVMRGSAGVLYGDNAIGGVINIVTKTGFEGPTSSFSAHGGSFNTQELDVQARWSDTHLAFILGANRFVSDGYRESNDSRITRVTADAAMHRAQVTWGSRLTIYRDHNQFSGATHADYSNVAPATLPMDGADTQTAFEIYFHDPWSAGELGYSVKSQDREPANASLGTRISTWSFTPRALIAEEDHIRIVGVDIYRNTLESAALYSELDLFPASNNRSGATRDSIALYVNDTYTFMPSVALAFGVRTQHVNTDLIGNSQTHAARNELVYSWDMSLQFRYPSGARSHVRAAESFRFPVLDEMWNNATGAINLLEPQQGHHIEAGGQFPFSKDTQFDASLFRITLEDEIGADTNASLSNLDPTEHFGGDLAFNTRAFNRWSMRVMYSHRTARFQAGPLKGKHLPEIPQKTLTFSNTLDAGLIGSFNINALFTGQTYFSGDVANTGKKMPSNTIINAGWLWDFSHGKLGISIKNLTDKRAADAGIYNRDESNYAYYPLPGRAYSMTLQATF